jgi:hypothetical protein
VLRRIIAIANGRTTVYAVRMKIEWRRGFLRAWAVLALAWVALVGWNERDQWSNGLSHVHSNGECWDRLAKWPDGKPFDVYDMFGEFDLSSNVEINKKENAWAADSIPERNRWRDIVTQKLRDCEAAKPILQRLTLAVSDKWPALKDSLSVIFFPPLALLIVGWLLGWIARGFWMTT